MIFKFGSLVIVIGAESAQENDRLVSCSRKVKYGSEPTALKAAEAMRRKYNSDLDAYKCRHCNGWHIGHKHGE